VSEVTLRVLVTGGTGFVGTHVVNQLLHRGHAVGVLARDQLWDRPVTLRFDVPLYVRDPDFAPGANAGDDRVRFRWTFSFADLW